MKIGEDNNSSHKFPGNVRSPYVHPECACVTRPSVWYSCVHSLHTYVHPQCACVTRPSVINRRYVWMAMVWMAMVWSCEWWGRSDISSLWRSPYLRIFVHIFVVLFSGATLFFQWWYRLEYYWQAVRVKQILWIVRSRPVTLSLLCNMEFQSGQNCITQNIYSISQNVWHARIGMLWSRKNTWYQSVSDLSNSNF